MMSGVWLIHWRNGTISAIFRYMDADAIFQLEAQRQMSSLSAAEPSPASIAGQSAAATAAASAGTGESLPSQAGAKEEVAERTASDSAGLLVPTNKEGGLLGLRWNSVRDLEQWLIQREADYGGRLHEVTCRYGVRESMERGLLIPKTRGKKKCSGGDRMAPPTTRGPKQMGYGICYAKVLDAFKDAWEQLWEVKGRTNMELAELGVLKGSGIAIWDELFPAARVHAFDRFLDNIWNNTPHLVSHGAFAHGLPATHYFDQAVPDKYPKLATILGSESSKFFFAVDDAAHYTRWSLWTHKWLEPYMDALAAYVVEDINEAEQSVFRAGLPADWAMWICPDASHFWLITRKLAEGSADAATLAAVMEKLAFRPMAYNNATSTAKS